MFYKLPTEGVPGRAISRYWLWLAPLALYALAYSCRDFSKTSRFFFVSNELSNSFVDIDKLLNVPKDFFFRIRDFISEGFPKFREQKLALLGLFLLILGKSVFLKNKNKRPAVFFVTVMFSYVFLLTLMRMDVFRNYYLFFFYLMMAAGVYSWVQFDRLTKMRQRGLFVFLIFLIITNFNGSKHEIALLLNESQPIQNYFEQIVHFVDEKKDEKDFSFAIQGGDAGVDAVCDIMKGYPDENIPVITMATSELIFYRYYRKTNPLYTFYWDNESGRFSERRNEMIL